MPGSKDQGCKKARLLIPSLHPLQPLDACNLGEVWHFFSLFICSGKWGKRSVYSLREGLEKSYAFLKVQLSNCLLRPCFKLCCATCSSHKGEADTVLALKDLTLVEDKFGMNQKYGKVLWEMGSVYRTHHSFPQGGRYLLGLEVSDSIISSWGQRTIKGRGKTCM